MELDDECMGMVTTNLTDIVPVDWVDYHALYITISVIVLTMMPVVLIGNGLIVAVVFKFQSLQDPSYMLLASLAISDFASGIIYGACMIGILVSGISTVYLMLMLPTGNIPIFQWCVSQTHIVALALDRYKCIMKPFEYLQVTKKRRLLVCVGVWIIGFFLGVLLYVSKRAVFANETPPHLSLYVVYIVLRLVMFASAIGVTVALHVRIYREARRHFRQIAAATPSNGQTIDFRAARTTSRILWAYLFCIFPAIVISIALVFPIPMVYDFINIYGLFIILTAMINAVVNPLIYATRDEKFRHAVGKLLHIRR